MSISHMNKSQHGKFKARSSIGGHTNVYVSFDDADAKHEIDQRKENATMLEPIVVSRDKKITQFEDRAESRIKMHETQ